jgi:hypothetical protein
LSSAFIDYLRADGIVLPPDEDGSVNANHDWSDNDSGVFSSAEDADSEASEDEDVSTAWRDVHAAIKSTITELSGKVVPKLNWSAPKDATWISATNSMDCRTANDIYLLLKSSDFVTHDLEQAFDGCDDDEDIEIPYHLALRKHVLMHVSLEFRCFVRQRRLVGISQRDLNHYDFLFQDNMQRRLSLTIQKLFDDKLRDTFPDENFVFDVYVPPPHDRAWLIDINPWAIRTDPLLFSWLELLTAPKQAADDHEEEQRQTLDEEDDSSVDEELESLPDFRVVEQDDPEAYAFNSPKYSAHKMPRDVVDASRSGAGGLKEFAQDWKAMLVKQQDGAADSSEDE